MFAIRPVVVPPAGYCWLGGRGRTKHEQSYCNNKGKARGKELAFCGFEVADEDKDFIAEAMALLPEGPYDSDSWGKYGNSERRSDSFRWAMRIFV